MKTFKAPRKALTGLDAETVAGLVVASADIALILDRRGIIRDLAIPNPELLAELGSEWLGRSLGEVVTEDSRPKIELLMRDLAAGQVRARQVNHPLADGRTVPIVYALSALDDDGRCIAQGRDLRAIAALQQRLIEAEQALERDYSKLRLAETRYRLLLQSIGEAVLTVDTGSQKVIELNPAAARLLNDDPKRLVGRAFTENFNAQTGRLVGDWLSGLRTAGRAEPLRLRPTGATRDYRLNGILFRHENASHALLRLEPLGDAAARTAPGSGPASLADIVQRLPDAIVVTGTDGRVFSSNRAFLDLVQLATDEQVRNESLERWLGRPGVDLGVLIANLKQHGSVRLFATTLRGEYGAVTEVEISAVAIDEGSEPCLGFSIRNVDRRRPSDARPGRELPRSVEQLTELVGRVSLKELVRETTDVIERLCIEAALELTRDNRASAAEMLGLSRQSLYVKLRRYGLGDLDGQAAD
ncbi:MAG: transcriptional regulator PpsR [Gammaproteobacteria bacterium]|nr:transcriptional regulator PpsR [Gammaproteobacteria bacterium]